MDMIAEVIAAVPRFDSHTHEETIARFVEGVRGLPHAGDRLAALLPESESLYAHRSTNGTARIRGYVMAAFEQIGLPDAAVPYVLEELENGREPYLVAAAAKAVRGLSRPTADLVPYLFAAIENIRLRDDAVTFECYRPRWPVTQRTSALTEIFRTFEWLGASATNAVARLESLLGDDSQPFTAQMRGRIARAIHRIRSDPHRSAADCCEGLSAFRAPVRWNLRWNRAGKSRLSTVVFENQDGRTGRYDEWCVGKPTIVVFFYTRCDNPNKCSLSIGKLARLQEGLRARGFEGRIRTLAITYDPGYDSAARLKTYGANRGILFGHDHHMVRTLHDTEALHEHFDLGVNFGPSTVNRHRIELFILDCEGAIVATFQRLQWNVDRVLDESAALLKAERAATPRPAPQARSFLWPWNLSGSAAGVMLALVPKCSVCWASYLSAAGIAGVSYAPANHSVRWVLLALVALNAVAVCVRSKHASTRYKQGSVLVSLFGTGAIMLASHFESSVGLLGGSLIVAVNSLMSASGAPTTRARINGPRGIL